MFSFFSLFPCSLFARGKFFFAFSIWSLIFSAKDLIFVSRLHVNVNYYYTSVHVSMFNHIHVFLCVTSLWA